MTTPITRALAASLVALALAGPLPARRGAHAEEPAATYPLHAWKRTWTAGATRTVTAQAHLAGLVRAESIDQATGQPQTFEQNLLEEESYSYVQRCEAADAQGAATAFRVFVSAWSSRDAELADTSLAGAHLEVSVKDGAYAWKQLNAAQAPTRLATKWLDKRFGAKREGDEGLDMGRLGTPKAPVKVGDTWAGDVKFMDDSMPLARDKSKVELRLAAVNDGVALVPVTVRLQTQGFPLGEGPEATLVPWTEGGALEGSGETRVSLVPGAFDGGNRFEGSLRGKAASEGLKVELTADMRGSVETRAGGAIPEMQPVEPRFGTNPPR